jgi:hypothetical protein
MFILHDKQILLTSNVFDVLSMRYWVKCKKKETIAVCNKANKQTNMVVCLFVMSQVCEIVRQFHDHGRVIRPYVGVTMVEVTNGQCHHICNLQQCHRHITRQ